MLEKALQPLLDAYHHWRYWGHLARSMKKNKRGPGSDDKKPGIAFSFDDSFRIEHWYKYGKDIFGFYDVKATFNINAYHHYEGQREHTQKEIDMLLDLQANGHEIAHHGFKHQRATLYAQEHGVDQWVEDEIKSLFKWMERQSHSQTKEKFKKPITFAFPYFKYNKQLIKKIVPKYFKVVRGHLYGNHLVDFNHTGLFPSICIDKNFLKKEKGIKKILKIAKRSNKNIILTCHSILPDDIDWKEFSYGSDAETASHWRITPETLKVIINEVKKLDMPFYTTAEIAGVATFIDSNFEKAIRKLQQNKQMDWISMEELSEIRSLDISNKNIVNLDGIEYFTKLETLNVSNNPIVDFRLLEKLPKLKKVIKTGDHSFKGA